MQNYIKFYSSICLLLKAALLGHHITSVRLPFLKGIVYSVDTFACNTNAYLPKHSRPSPYPPLLIPPYIPIPQADVNIPIYFNPLLFITNTIC